MGIEEVGGEMKEDEILMRYCVGLTEVMLEAIIESLRRNEARKFRLERVRETVVFMVYERSMMSLRAHLLQLVIGNYDVDGVTCSEVP